MISKLPSWKRHSYPETDKHRMYPQGFTRWRPRVLEGKHPAAASDRTLVTVRLDNIDPGLADGLSHLMGGRVRTDAGPRPGAVDIALEAVVGREPPESESSSDLPAAIAYAIRAWRRTARALELPAGSLSLGGRTRVMGILNCTPDSFSDGGQFDDVDCAVAHAMAMAEAGADIIDVGGQSTRPGSKPVGPEEEIRRTIPVIEKLADLVEAPISIDTWHAPVARAALEAGASIVNDVTALRGDPDMAGLVAEAGAGLVLMHMQGTPETMQKSPRYDDVAGEVYGFLAERVEAAVEAGVDPSRLVVDPGIGFGKTMDHNLALLNAMASFRSLDCPVLIGASRKSFIGNISKATADKRLGGSIAVAVLAATRGIEIVRVHDVPETVQAIRVTEAIEGLEAKPDRQHVG
jgi:dihydropteroate synthase